MNEIFFKIAGIQKKMEANQNLQTAMKATGALILFVIFFCSLNQPDTMKIAWLLSIPFLGLLFIFDIYYISQHKKYEFELYKLETENLEKKKKIAEIKGEVLSDSASEHEITMPSKEVSLPILYYAVLITLDFLIKVFILH